MASIKETLDAVKAMELKLDPEFRSLLGEQSQEERKALKESMQAEGIRDPLVVWKEENILVDGYNRHDLSQELDIPFKIELRSFKNREEVEQWIVRNQLGRRNLTPDRFNYFVGKLYNAAPEGKKTQTSEKLADEFGKSAISVRKDGDFAAGVDKLAAIRGKLAKDTVLAGKSSLKKKDVENIGKTVNLSHAKKLVEIIDAKQETIRTQKARAKAAVSKLTVKYGAIFANPDFTKEQLTVFQAKRPPLADNCYLFLLSEDEWLGENMKLMAHWGFGYEGSWILGLTSSLPSPWSKIKHQQMLIGVRGVVEGPAKGKEPESYIRTHDPYDTVFKTIEAFLPVKPEERLDMTGRRKDWAHIKG